jgi:periplasmic protein TonB
MAYLSSDTPRARVAALGAVAALHGIMALAILTGFAGGIFKEIEKNRIEAWNYVDPIDPPEPVPTITPAAAPAKNQRETLPKPELMLPRDPFRDTELPIDLGPLPSGGFGGNTGSILEPLAPKPSPSASFIPRTARPLTTPGRWVSEADYPTNALRRGEQGVTGFEVTVGSDGRVRDCTVTRSSGSAELDAATCTKVTQRARFDPASDESGAVVAGRYRNAIRWQIPE